MALLQACPSASRSPALINRYSNISYEFQIRIRREGRAAADRREPMPKRNATAAIIGAGDFIGAEIAKKFAAGGFTIFAGRRNGDKLAPLVNEIQAGGGKIFARSLDG